MSAHLLPIAVFMFFAEAPMGAEWGVTLANYGIAGVMLVYFMLRDKQERDARDAERKEANRIQEEHTKALTLMAKSTMAYVVALKHLDGALAEMAKKLQEEADSNLSSIQSR